MYNNLVICPVGVQSLHRLWDTDNRNFDVVLICYNKDAYETFKNDAGKVYFQKGYKYQLIKDYLNYNGIKYDNYCFIDDDTGIDAEGINKIFEFIDKTNIEVCHPAVESKNQPNQIIQPNPDTEYRFTNWTEIQCLFMKKGYLGKVVDLFGINVSGWGMPDLMYVRTDIPYCIYDLVTVQHCRATNTGIDPLYSDINTAFDELNEVKSGIEKYEYKVLGFKLRNMLSFCIIFDQNKAYYLPDCIQSLPEGSEIVLLETIQSDEKQGIDGYVKNGNNIYAKYYYKEWNYSDARNACKSLAARPVIFSIDSDERLLAHQHTAIIKAALDLYKSDFMGYQVRNISCYPNWENNTMYSYQVSECVRIFKNIPQLSWKGKVHETIDQSMIEQGFKYSDSNIMLHHIGYEADIDTMLEKSHKRLKALISTDEPLKHETYYKYVIQEAHNIKVLETIKNRGK